MSHTFHDQKKHEGAYDGASLPKVSKPEPRTSIVMQLRDCGKVTDLILQGQAHALTNEDMRQIADFYNTEIKGRF